MKIKKIAALALIGLGFTASQAYAAGATSGTVEFFGMVDASTCTINGDANKAVHIDNLATTTGLTVGSPLNAQTFRIQVSGCTPSGNVEAMFVPQNPDTDHGNNQLANSGTATGIDIGLYDGTDTSKPITWRTPTTTVVADNNGTANLNYTAAYVPTLTTAGAGTISAKVEYQLTYN